MKMFLLNTCSWLDNDIRSKNPLKHYFITRLRCFVVCSAALYRFIQRTLLYKHLVFFPTQNFKVYYSYECFFKGDPLLSCLFITNRKMKGTIILDVVSDQSNQVICIY